MTVVPDLLKGGLFQVYSGGWDHAANRPIVHAVYRRDEARDLSTWHDGIYLYGGAYPHRTPSHVAPIRWQNLKLIV